MEIFISFGKVIISIISNKQTFSSVVIARVAMLRLTSVIKFSRSKLQVVTDMG